MKIWEYVVILCFLVFLGFFALTMANILPGADKLIQIFIMGVGMER